MQSTSTKRVRRDTARVLSAINLVALLATSAGCVAQTEPPVAAAGLAPPPAPRIGAAPLVEGTAVSAQATVSRFLINPDGDVDGFLTGDGALVHFPPHMSAQLTSAIRPGDSVQIDGWRVAGGNLEAQRITDARSGQQLTDQPPLPGTLPRELRGAGLSRLSAQGQVAHITTAPRGEPDGVILADGTVIKLTPPVAQQFPRLVQSGARVSAQGYGTRNQYGTALQATSFGSPGNLTRLYDRVAPGP
ncbi:hypothetical protein AWB73_03530 [Caballeronia turbans]|jgi:hypothetical protein|uniref:hypothetical protein n=1 Tax=unclassified Caballeronia TaxID=2646786 RepID=UPI00074CD28D|nr:MULTISPECIES: hypothetical protein [unclassified Caballeronia]SAL36167.1 hypothetical protein AWB73_03530 [Caballeronia turbans]